MLKALKTMNPRRVIRVTLASDYLDEYSLANYIEALDCVTISPDIYISIFRMSQYPLINIDEFFNYIELMGIDLTIDTQERTEAFLILVEILETKYGIEYVDSDS